MLTNFGGGENWRCDLIYDDIPLDYILILGQIVNFRVLIMNMIKLSSRSIDLFKELGSLLFIGFRLAFELIKFELICLGPWFGPAG